MRSIILPFNLKKHREPKHFIKTPGYPGGKKALDDFIGKNLRYPAQAIQNRIEGTVFVEFDIDHKGNTKNLSVKTGLGYGCDEEAIRLVELLNYKSFRHRGIKVSFHKTIGIHFNLKKKDTPVQQIAYTYKEKEHETATKSYTYTIINKDANSTQ